MAVGGGASFFAWTMNLGVSSMIIPANAPIRIALLSGQTLSVNRIVKDFGIGSLSLSSIDGNLPTMSLSTPSSQLISTTSTGYLEYSTSSTDIGQVVSVALTAVNSSLFNLVARENYSQFGVKLAAGQILRDRVSSQTSKLFTFFVPSEISGAIVFSLDSSSVSFCDASAMKFV